MAPQPRLGWCDARSAWHAHHGRHAHHACIAHSTQVRCNVLRTNCHCDQRLPLGVASREANAHPELYELSSSSCTLEGYRDLDDNALAIRFAECQARFNQRTPVPSPCLEHELICAEREGLVRKAMARGHRTWYSSTLEEYRVCGDACMDEVQRCENSPRRVAAIERRESAIASLSLLGPSSFVCCRLTPTPLPTHRGRCRAAAATPTRRRWRYRGRID